MGTSALAGNTTGTNNISVGNSALWRNDVGSYNTAVGSQAMAGNRSGTYNSSLGSNSNVSVSNLTNATAIGSSSIVNASNKIRFGDASVTVVEGPVAYTVSDGRFKTNISESDIKGLAFIKQLRPVVYNFDAKKFEEFLTQNMPDSLRRNYLDNKDFSTSTAIRQSGFIAQEVEKAAKETGYDFNGIHAPENKDDNYSLAYGQFTVPLVKAVQELSAQNDSLKKELEELRALILSKTANNGGYIIFGETDAAKLFQNAPNPFNHTTVIRYSIPAAVKTAMVTVTSSTGERIKEFDVKNNNRPSIEIAGGQLPAGVYIYSLVVDGKMVDSKQMTLTH
jgi:hypothetical protein